MAHPLVGLALVLLALAFDHTLSSAWTRCLGDQAALACVAELLTRLVVVPLVALAALLVSMLDRRVRWGFVSDIAVVMILQGVAVDLLKLVFGRLRPDAAHETTIFFVPSLQNSGFSFPSGHAAAAFALAAVLIAWYPRWRAVFCGLAIAVCLARVQLCRHFLSDVIAGAYVGWWLAQGLMIWRRRLTAAWRRRRAPKPAAEPTAEPAPEVTG